MTALETTPETMLGAPLTMRTRINGIKRMRQSFEFGDSRESDNDAAADASHAASFNAAMKSDFVDGANGQNTEQ